MRDFEEAAQKTAASEDSVLTITAVTDFSWDEMLIFEPYTSTAEIHAELGYNWSAAETTHIHSSDTFHLLVFLRDGKVAQYFKVWRRIGDFEGLETRRRFARKDAVFTVVRVTDGANSRLRFSPKSGEGLILRGAAMPGGGSIGTEVIEWLPSPCWTLSRQLYT